MAERSRKPAMSKDKLTDQLREALQPLVERYLESPSDAAQQTQHQIEQLQEHLTQLEGTPAAKGLQQAIKDLAAERDKDQDKRREEASLAVIQAGRSLGLRLALPGQNGPTGKGAARPGPSGAGRQGLRAGSTPHQIVSLLDKHHEGLKVGEVRKAFDESKGHQIGVALSNLKKKGLVEQNGDKRYNLTAAGRASAAKTSS